MSDQDALDRQSTSNECMCDQNTHEHSCKHASLAITHNDQSTYQTIHLKHNNSIKFAKTVLGNQFKPDVTT